MPKTIDPPSSRKPRVSSGKARVASGKARTTSGKAQTGSARQSLQPRERTLIRTGVTAGEYFAMQDDRRMELIEGELYMVPSPETDHTFVPTKLTRFIDEWIDTHGGMLMSGTTDVLIDNGNVLVPDLVFLAKDHPQCGRKVAFIDPPPTMVLEVISPSSRIDDRKHKYRRYQKVGVANYWIADPVARTLDAFTLVDGVYQPVPQADAAKFSAPPFDGLVIDISKIFLPLIG